MAKPKQASSSPAMQLLELTWKNVSAATGHSWERLNHAMHYALEMAICYGFRFDEGDFSEISKRFRPHRWVSFERAYVWAVTGGRKGKHVPSGEKLVKPHNMSAVQALEAFCCPCWMLRGFRLFVGAEIYWADPAGKNAEAIRATGMRWFQSPQTGPLFRVTSINDERVVLSHYPNRTERRPTRVLKITRDLLAEQNALFAPPKKTKTKEVDRG